MEGDVSFIKCPGQPRVRSGSGDKVLSAYGAQPSLGFNLLPSLFVAYLNLCMRRWQRDGRLPWKLRTMRADWWKKLDSVSRPPVESEGWRDVWRKDQENWTLNQKRRFIQFNKRSFYCGRVHNRYSISLTICPYSCVGLWAFVPFTFPFPRSFGNN